MNILSPKTSFVEDKKRADRHMETMMDPRFHAAAQVALAEYALRVARKDALAGPFLLGAKEFLEILMNLGDPQAEPTDTSDLPQLTPP